MLLPGRTAVLQIRQIRIGSSGKIAARPSIRIAAWARTDGEESKVFLTERIVSSLSIRFRFLGVTVTCCLLFAMIDLVAWESLRPMRREGTDGDSISSREAYWLD